MPSVLGPQRFKEEAQMNAPVTTPPVQLVPGNTLITATPEDGRQLAIKLARLVVKTTQSDPAIRQQLRTVYSRWSSPPSPPPTTTGSSGRPFTARRVRNDG
jgi:hypothetical protein